MPQIKGVLFDWNGTVLDDANASLAGANALFSAAGCKEISLARFRKTFQIPIDQYVNQNGLSKSEYKKNVVEFQRIFRNEYREHVKYCKTKKNARKLLQWLQKKKIKIGILSADMEEDIHFNLKRLKLESYIDAIVGHKTIVTGQHASKDVPKAARLLKVPKENLLIVGDTGHDISVGKEFNVPVVAVTGGYYSRKRLKELKPDYLISDLWDVKRILEKQNAA